MIDFLAIGAHADDIEIGAGGTVAKMARSARSGALLDLTDASMGTRGTPATRLVEAARAAEILGVPQRRNLGLRDGFLRAGDPEAVAGLIAAIRELRPRVILTHPLRDRHPDHEACASLVREASFKAGLARFPAEGEPWRPRRVFHWMGARDGNPDFCIDVSETWSVRTEALLAFGTQFLPVEGQPATAISTTAFHDVLHARARHLGARIRAEFAEGFTCEELPEVVDLCALSDREF